MTTTDSVERHQKAASDLKARVRGAVLEPGNPAYDESRSLWNAMIDRRPAVIVRCLGTADVIAGVRAAREYDLPLTIKGGGHNIAGLAVCDGGLMLDMSLMRGVWVDPAAKVAHAQAGCLLGDVDRETQLHGLAAVLGFVSNTGCAGLTLGGGFGYLSRRFGWTSDNVASIDLVTADGRAIRASEREHSDLFWGLRGGGGNFGVATSFEYALHPVGPDIIGGAIAWRGEDAGRVLEMYRTLVADAPPELTCVAGLRLAPPAPWLAPEVHGKPIVALFVCYSGSLADGEKLLAPIKAFGAPVGDIVQKRPYVSQQSATRCDPAEGAPLLLEIRVPARLRTRTVHAGDRARRANRVAALGNSDLPARRRDQPAARGPLSRWQPRRGRGPQHRRLVGARRRRQQEHRLGARRLARPAPVLDRRHVRELPDRRRRRRAHARGVSDELRAPGRGQGGVGSVESAVARTRTSCRRNKAARDRASASPEPFLCDGAKR